MGRKKIKKLGYIVVALLLVSAAVIALLAALGVFGGDTKGFSLFGNAELHPEDKYPLFGWQTGESSDDLQAVFKTSAGDFSVKLSSGEATAKFRELAENGRFGGKEFSVAAEDLFIQTNASDETFTLNDEGYGCFYGSLGFVLGEGNATDSLFIITAKKLSGISKGWLNKNSPDDEYSSFFGKYGGVPQYSGKVIVFAQVTEGFDVIEKIAASENSGYTSGYQTKEPVKITSVQIVEPAE